MTATLSERICARIVHHLGDKIEVLNHVPFGLRIMCQYRTYAVRSSYSNETKLEAAHLNEKYPDRNLIFCKFVFNHHLEKALATNRQPVRVLEVGAGRSINANIIHKLCEDGHVERSPEFILVDRYVNPSKYLDAGVKVVAVMIDATDLDLSNLPPIHVGITRATLSLMPPRDAKRAITTMAKSCETLVLNEAAMEGPIRYPVIRADRHIVHPYQEWLRDLGRSSKLIDWSAHDRTYDGIVVA